MARADAFLGELDHEAATTRKILTLVPLEKADWKPHEKSMTLGRLAAHVAELPYWVVITCAQDELDFAKFEYKPFVPESTEALLAFFDKNVNAAVSELKQCSDEKMMQPWSMRQGETIFFTMPRVAVIRTFNMNHLVHHRAQLGLYLRLLNIPIPGSYGPSADES